MKRINIFTILICGTVLILLSACVSTVPYSDMEFSSSDTTGPAPVYPDARFMVIADSHYYDAALGTSGAAWDEYMKEDRKLLKESGETIEVIFDRIKEAKPDFVILPGDLTKDGEKQGLQQMADWLEELKVLGINSFVIPGNHDINNFHAKRFLPDGSTELVEHVTPEEFVDIFEDFGYDNALYRDPSSLSYIAEPVEGLWIAALDSCKYENNGDPELKWSETSGAIRDDTYIWLEGCLKEASEKGIAVIAMEHHPMLEHVYDMRSWYPEYVLDDRWRLATLLAHYDVKLIFTGHFHANSIVQHKWDEGQMAGKYIVDIETGSPVTWPCPFRTVTLSPQQISITTDRVEQLASYNSEGRNFSVEGKGVIENGLSNIVSETLAKYKVTEKGIVILTPQIVASMMAHYYGDAEFTGEGDLINTEGIGIMGNIVVNSYKDFIAGLWKQIEPEFVSLMPDNQLIINADGSWE